MNKLSFFRKAGKYSALFCVLPMPMRFGTKRIWASILFKKFHQVNLENFKSSLNQKNLLVIVALTLESWP